jgi:hypothetical protein
MTPPERRGLAAGLTLFGGLLLVRWVVGRLARRDRLAVDQAALVAGHETQDVQVGLIVAAGLGLMVMLAAILVIVTWLQGSFIGRGLTLNPAPGMLTVPAPAPPPPPRLEEVPGQELREVRATQEVLLHSYGWVDRQAGQARIPIERAIDLLVQRGLPARTPDDAERYRDRGGELPSDSSSGRTSEAPR